METTLDQYVASYASRDLLRDVWSFVRPYRKSFIGASLLRLSSDIASLYPSFAFASVVTFLSHYRAGGSLVPFWTIMGLWALAALWRNISVWGAKYLIFQTAEKANLDAQLAATQHLLRLDLAWHERENVGNKVKRIDRGGESINQLVRIWITNVIEIVVNFVGMIFIVYSFSHGVALVMAIFVVVFFILSRALSRPALTASHLVNAQEETFDGILFQAAQNIRTIKALGAVRTIMSHFQESVTQIVVTVKKRIFAFQTRAYSLSYFATAVRVSTLAYIGYGVTQGHFELGFLVLFNGYFNAVWMSADELSSVSQDYIIARQSVARLSNLLHEPLGIDAPEGKIPFPEHWQEVRFEHVSFTYGHQQVLKDLNFTIRRGERVGLVGLSGAGKSTLMKLLLKEYEPTAGRIMVDESDLAFVDRDSYLKRVAAVLQDTEVFNFSLKDNVLIASEGSPDVARFEQALAIAHVKDFLEKLPEGVDTLVGEKGVKLSGGEKQRLGLARAVYKQPDILLLDEATSHLDLESEQKIQDSLHRVFQSVTAVVIAHRLTTIKEMDTILLVERGSILESGPFTELIAKQGRFFELWEKQKL